jgi:hypothetical protein
VRQWRELAVHVSLKECRTGRRSDKFVTGWICLTFFIRATLAEIQFGSYVHMLSMLKIYF